MPESHDRQDDLRRLRKEYAAREHRFARSDYYSHSNLANLFAYQQRQREILSALSVQNLDLSQTRMLDLGCGNGGVLLEFLSYGIQPRNLHGCELLSYRLRSAYEKLPHLCLVNADGQNLPYMKYSFDLVLQFTVFSSILSDEIRHNLAQEMLRVLKPTGMILWYDFWLNPTNPQTRGIRPAEIRSLFPDCIYKFHKITLAPPIARRLVPVSWILCLVLEKIKVFNTHYLAVIRPQSLPQRSPSGPPGA